MSVGVELGERKRVCVLGQCVDRIKSERRMWGIMANLCAAPA